MNEVIFIGTSDAFGAGGRRQSATLIRGDRGCALLDCGATTNSGLADLEISRDEIDTVVISHFHGDHFGGLPLFLFACLYEDQRRKPLRVAGPPGIEDRVRGLADAMGHSFEDRDWSFPLHFHEAPPGSQHEIGPARLQSFETRHQLEAHPHGYRVSLGNRTVVYTGDTGWFAELPRLCAGADLLISECTLYDRQLDFHLSLDEICAHRSEFDVGSLILTHLGQAMSERRGQVELETADDGLIVKL